jgi:hypothetical protein
MNSWQRGLSEARGGEPVSSDLMAVVILVTLLHVAAFSVMIWIRVRRSEADGTPAESARITPCAVCGQPATHRGYDGLDPNERYDPHTGRYWSAEVAHYPALCADH